MTIEAWLKRSIDMLQAADVSTARLDCLVLLEDILNTNRTQILAQPERILTEVERQILDELIANRANHTPLAYLRKKSEFYGRAFYIDERVLEPRPESETMIDLLLKLKPKAPKIADVGSGSGALGITAKHELPNSHVTLLEIDADALAVSQKNAQQHKVDVQVLQSDLLKATDEHFDLLLCNLPYVPESFHINTAATHEPRLAIFGGLDGLDLYLKLFEQVNKRKSKPSYILTESLPTQHHQLATLARKHGYTLEKTDDFIQLFIQT
ncbi:peptide chain release factor N(5)-glutamine methyltransferase [Candidatus Saccharibacteria bacterium]|nr:peptide chain release factor N(5)-glutamine methyltransferase [Candidatus Saccharibacteria bacterium]